MQARLHGLAAPTGVSSGLSCDPSLLQQQQQQQQLPHSGATSQNLLSLGAAGLGHPLPASA